MKTFSWHGYDAQGTLLSGAIESTTRDKAKQALMQQGIFAQRITRQTPSFLRPTIRHKDIIFFTRHMATLLKSGVPLLQALSFVSQSHRRPGLQQLIEKLRVSIEEGHRFSEALQQFPKQFSKLYCSLIIVAEQAGTLDISLEYLANYQEKILTIQSKVRTAMIYPLAIIVAASLAMVVIMIVVIPQFQTLFESFGSTLPLATRIVIACSEFLVQWGGLFAVFIGALIGLFQFAKKRSLVIRQFQDKSILRLPIFGKLLRQSIIARWNRTLATLFISGIPLVEALGFVANTCDNTIYEEASRNIQLAVQSGSGFGQAVEASACFPPMVFQMIAVGEETGALDHMLEKTAEFLERETDEAIATLSSLLEPVIIVLLGTMIGGVIIAMYLPLFQLGQLV